MKPIAHIWKTSYGWRLEISEGSIQSGFRIISDTMHRTKSEAKRAAHTHGALPWNY